MDEGQLTLCWFEVKDVAQLLRQNDEQSLLQELTGPTMPDYEAAQESRVNFKRLRQSDYGTLTVRLGLLMVLYTASRLAFFAINQDFFADITAPALLRIFAAGTRFDLAAVMYVNLLFLCLWLLPTVWRFKSAARVFLNTLFVATNSLALILNCIDFVYYPFIFKRMTGDVVQEFAHEQNFGGLLAQMALVHWPALVASLISSAAVVGIAAMAPLHNAPDERQGIVYTLRAVLIWGSALFLAAVACRGGFFVVSHRPITNSTAAAYVQKPEQMALVLNTPFSLIRTFDKTTLEERHDFASEAELEAIYTPVQHFESAQPMNKLNVVIFILESFGPNAIGALNPDLENGTYAGYTPFLDSLMGKCHNFDNAFANGLHSIEALPPIVASIPNVKQKFVLSNYYNNDIRGLGTILGEQGYETAFFHGAPNGSMGFDAFVKTAGFKRYYGLNEYPNPDDYDGAWGVWDEEFFQYYAQTLNSFKPPFAAALFSVTSHSPFRVPKRYENKFKRGPSRGHQVMAYTDYSLQRFFETAEKMPWFKDTLFVITADHSAVRTHAKYKTVLGRFRVPLLFCHFGNEKLAQRDTHVAQHVDVMPTVLGYLRFSGAVLAFGRNLLAEDRPPQAVNYHPGGPYQYVQDDALLQFDGQRTTGVFDYLNDPFLQKNRWGENPDRDAVMEKRLRAFIQQYNNRMRENRLVAH